MNNYLTPREYLPHEPPMVLIDKVLYVDENKAVTQCFLNDKGVLAPFLNKNGDLPSFFALEIFAQSVGVWNGFNQRGSGFKTKMGMVLGARDLKVKEDVFKSSSVLNIEVNKNMSDGTLANFEGRIFVCSDDDSDSYDSNAPFASGRVNVISIKEENRQKLFYR